MPLVNDTRKKKDNAKGDPEYSTTTIFFDMVRVRIGVSYRVVNGVQTLTGETQWLIFF